MTNKPEQIFPSVNISWWYKRSWVINVMLNVRHARWSLQRATLMIYLWLQEGSFTSVVYFFLGVQCYSASWTTASEDYVFIFPSLWTKDSPFYIHFKITGANFVTDASFSPCFVNNDYVTAEIICSTAYVCHEVLTWLWATLCGTPVPAPPIKPWELLLYHSCVCCISQERREHSVSAAMAAVSARRE